MFHLFDMLRILIRYLDNFGETIYSRYTANLNIKAISVFLLTFVY